MALEDLERRNDPRVQGETLTVEFLAPVPRVRDLSISGLFILDPRPLQRGQTVQLRITLGSGAPLIVTGMVRRVEPGVGMAIEFTQIDASARRRIKEYVARNEKNRVSAAGPDR